MARRREVDDRRGSGRVERAATPALVCPACRQESPLDQIFLGEDRALRCLHCGHAFADDADSGPRDLAISLFEALHVGSADAVLALLHPDAVWFEQERGRDIRGATDVAAHLLRAGVRHSLRSLTSPVDAVEVRVTVAADGSSTVERWRIESSEQRIVRVLVDTPAIDLDADDR